jgi:hypothetical protein
MEKPPNAAPESEHQEVTARETRAAAAEEYLQQGQAPYGKTGTHVSSFDVAEQC